MGLGVGALCSLFAFVVHIFRLVFLVLLTGSLLSLLPAFVLRILALLAGLLSILLVVHLTSPFWVITGADWRPHRSTKRWESPLFLFWGITREERNLKYISREERRAHLTMVTDIAVRQQQNRPGCRFRGGLSHVTDRRVSPPGRDMCLRYESFRLWLATSVSISRPVTPCSVTTCTKCAPPVTPFTSTLTIVLP